VQHPCLVVAEELKGEKVEPLLLATQRPGSVAGSKASLKTALIWSWAEIEAWAKKTGRLA